MPDLLPGLPDNGYGIPTGGGGGAATPPGAPELGLPSPLAGVAGLPTTGPRGPALLFQPTATLSEILTDNVRYTATRREGDLITRLTPGISILSDTPRVQGQLTASFNYNKYANASDLDNLSASLYTSSLTTIVPDALFLDLRSSLSEASTTGGLGFINPSQLPQSQLTQVFTNVVSPFYRKSFGGLLDTEVRYTFASTSFSGGTLSSSSPTLTNAALANDSTSNEGTLTFATGRDFTRLSSRLTLDAAKTEAGAVSSTQLVGYDDVQYPFTDTISAIGRLGYEHIDYPGFPAANIDSPTYLIGGQVQFGPRGYLSLQYGQQLGATGVTGSARYDITPKTSVTASVTQGQTTTQQQIAGNLSLSGFTPGGLLINQRTGLPTALVNPQFGLQNVIFTYQTFNAGVTSEIGNNTFSLFATYNQQVAKAGGSGTSTDTSLSFNWSRSLNPDMTAHATLGYATVTNPTFGIVSSSTNNTDSYSATVGLTYLIGYNLSGSVLYSFLYQTNPIPGITVATAQSGNVTVNQLQFTITKAF